MNKLTKIKNKVIATVISSMAVANMMAMKPTQMAMFQEPSSPHGMMQSPRSSPL